MFVLFVVAFRNQPLFAVVSQVPDFDALLTHVFSDLEENPDKVEGTGLLLFEMCKGVRNMFHSCAANVSLQSDGTGSDPVKQDFFTLCG